MAKRQTTDAMREVARNRQPRRKPRVIVDPAIALCRTVRAMAEERWAKRGGPACATSGRHPLISTERQRGPRMLLSGAL